MKEEEVLRIRAEGVEAAIKSSDREIRVEVPDIEGVGKAFGRTYRLSQIEEFESDFNNDDRRKLIDQAVLALDNLYVHKDLKWTRHAVDAGCSLRALRRVSDTLSDREFHARVSEIFKSLRDIHTVYTLPEPYRRLIAFLPFTISLCKESNEGAERFIVTRLMPGFAPEHMRPGVEILTWNGLPMIKAVREAGRRESAANDAALLALGVRLMTVRWLGTSPLPPTEWVTLGYRDLEGVNREMRLHWKLLKIEDDSELILPIQTVWMLETSGDGSESRQALDQGRMVEREMTVGMFGKKPRQELEDPESKLAEFVCAVPPPPGLEPFFSAAIYKTKVDGKEIEFGRLRIRHFHTPNSRMLIRGFKKMLEQMPPDYLLIDIRANPGGQIDCAEICVQFLTPRRVKPLPFQFLATPFCERLVTNDGGVPDDELKDWTTRVSESVANGQQYSREMPMTDPALFDAMGAKQTYFGTVGLLTDAITYSSGDIFAAHFADLEIGPIIGVDKTTGGGGANMVFLREVAGLAPKSLGLDALPHDARIHFAFRRFRRMGLEPGELIEEVGVTSDEIVPLNAEDAMTSDRAFCHRCAEILVARKRTSIDVVCNRDAKEAVFEVTLDPPESDLPVYLFILINGRPRDMLSFEDGRATFNVPRPPEGQTEVEIRAHVLKSQNSRWLRDEPLAVYTEVVPGIDADQGSSADGVET